MDVKDTLHTIHLFVKAGRPLERAVWFEGSLALRVFELNGEIKANLVYQNDGLLVEPFHALTVFPESILNVALRAVYVGAKAVLFALVPPTLVLASICPVINSEPFLLVHNVLSVVAHPIGIHVNAKALHIVGFPLTVVFATIFPEVHSIAVEFVVQPLAIICRTVGPGVLTSALFLAHDVLALVLGSFRPGLDPMAVLLIFLPVAFVSGPLDIGVDSEAVGLVVHPSPVIDVAIGMEELAVAASLIVLPVAFESRRVHPQHCALPVT